MTKTTVPLTISPLVGVKAECRSTVTSPPEESAWGTANAASKAARTREGPRTPPGIPTRRDAVEIFLCLCISPEQMLASLMSAPPQSRSILCRVFPPCPGPRPTRSRCAKRCPGRLAARNSPASCARMPRPLRFSSVQRVSLAPGGW